MKNIILTGSANRRKSRFPVAAAIIAGFLASACGGGGGASPSIEQSAGRELINNIRENSGGEAVMMNAERVQAVASGITADKSARRAVAGTSQNIGSITQSTNGNDRVRVKKESGNIAYTAGEGLLALFNEPVVENTAAGRKWEGTNLSQPANVTLDYAYVVCDGATCNSAVNNVAGETAGAFYYVSGFWHQDGDFGAFADGSPHTSNLPTDRTASFVGLSSGYYWQGEDTPKGSYLGVASFTANFNNEPAVSGEMEFAAGFDGALAINEDLGGVVFSFAESAVSLTNGIYAVSGGGVSCGAGCTLGDASENSWGGMFINVSAEPSPVPDAFAGTYGISDVEINGKDYDFLGIFASADSGAGELGDVAANPSPNPDPTPTESVVAQFGQADNIGDAALVSLTIVLSQDAQSGLNFSIGDGIDGSILNDVDPVTDAVWGNGSYISFGEKIYWNELEKISGSGENMQFSYYDIYTNRENNRDSEYWVGGHWFEWIENGDLIGEGGSASLNDYELGALAYYEGLPLRNIPNSGTAVYHGQASALALDTTRSDRDDLYNYADWKVRLNAGFSGGGSIGGELYDIIGTAGDMPLPSNITLNAANINNDGFFSGATAADGYAAGNWGGQLYGDGASHAAGTFAIDKSDGSQGLAGWFQAEQGIPEPRISDDEKSIVQFGAAGASKQVSLSYIDVRADYLLRIRSDIMFNSDGILVDSRGNIITLESVGFSLNNENMLIDSNGNVVRSLIDGSIIEIDSAGNEIGNLKYHGTGPAGSDLQNIGAKSDFESGVVVINGEDVLYSTHLVTLSGGNVLEANFYTDRTYQESRDRTTDYLEGGIWLNNLNESDLANVEIGAFAAYPELPLADMPGSGTAVYSGSATGVGLDTTRNANGDFTNYASWRATLNADFGANSVSGALSDISRTEGDRPMPSDITLGAASVNGNGFFNGATNAAGYDNGNWGGRFFGDEASHAAGTFGLQKTDGTQGIVGFFHAENE